MRTSWKWPLGSLSVLVWLVACTTGPKFIPDSYLRNMAAAQFQQLQEEATVSQNPVHNAQVQRVGQRVASAAADLLPGATWEFVVFEDESANAFAMPGGKIGVHTGLLALCSSDDELAVVMGHEVAHVILEHSNQRMSMGVIIAFGQVGAAYGTKELSPENRAMVMAAYGLGSQFGVSMPFSRAHESQADEEGLYLSARAGYDPRAAVSFWQKMGGGGPQPPEYASTHPSHDRRIRDLERVMPKALELYRAAGGAQ